MTKPVGMEVAVAAAEAVALCNIDVAACYPITPNTHIAEHLADIIADGRIDAEYITVESEHSALSAVMGASGTGARTFTATSSQGLMYMHEILPITPAMRLPVVMGLGNRAVSGPINIWNDHSDIIMQRDSGWLSIFADNGQEAVDMFIQAFKIAEHPDVLLPINVNMDGFQLTHVVEPIVFPTQAQVNKFLPPYKPFASLHPDHPLSMGHPGTSEIYTEAVNGRGRGHGERKEGHRSRSGRSGRSSSAGKYEPVMTYKTAGAEILILTMGSMGETAEVAVDALRKKGVKVGLLKLKLWRPFPFDEIRKGRPGGEDAGRDRPGLILRRSRRTRLFGIRAALYDQPNRPEIVNYIIGLGGRTSAWRTS